MYLPIPYKIKYDVDKFPFQKIVKRIFGVDNLYNLHKLEKYDTLSREKDQSTKWHKLYYDNFSHNFETTYIELVKELKKQLEYTELIYQKVPTFRVQLANGNVGVGEWHKDKNYNHGCTEVNFWLPFVDTIDVNSVWMETKEDLRDYKPFKVDYGEILVFNGANLLHGNKNNNSDMTRTSIDFRLVDPLKFIPNKSGSINTNTSFEVGGYFSKI